MESPLTKSQRQLLRDPKLALEMAINEALRGPQTVEVKAPAPQVSFRNADMVDPHPSPIIADLESSAGLPKK